MVGNLWWNFYFTSLNMASVLPLAIKNIVVIHHLLLCWSLDEAEGISIVLVVVGRNLTHKHHFKFAHSKGDRSCSIRINTLNNIESDSSVAEGHVITAQTGFLLVSSAKEWFVDWMWHTVWRNPFYCTGWIICYHINTGWQQTLGMKDLPHLWPCFRQGETIMVSITFSPSCTGILCSPLAS